MLHWTFAFCLAPLGVRLSLSFILPSSKLLLLYSALAVPSTSLCLCLNVPCFLFLCAKTAYVTYSKMQRMAKGSSPHTWKHQNFFSLYFTFIWVIYILSSGCFYLVGLNHWAAIEINVSISAFNKIINTTIFHFKTQHFCLPWFCTNYKLQHCLCPLFYH